MHHFRERVRTSEDFQTQIPREHSASDTAAVTAPTAGLVVQAANTKPSTPMRAEHHTSINHSSEPLLRADHSV